MSKSLKNYAAAPEVLNKSGADATRQWAAGGGATGSDIPYRAQDVEYGRRFLVKLWNVAGFASNLLADYKPQDDDDMELELLDKWILSKTENLTQKVTEAFEKCQFNIAVEEIRNFTWHVFCDFYVEAVKDRLYQNQKFTAKLTAPLHNTPSTKCFYRMLATARTRYPPLDRGNLPIHVRSKAKASKAFRFPPGQNSTPHSWTKQQKRDGDLITAIMSEVRRDKAEKKLPLNAPIKNLTIYAANDATADRYQPRHAYDIAATLKIENIKVFAEAG